METITVNSLSAIATTLELQTRLFNNAVANISEETATSTLSENVNHIKWLTGHLVSTRHMMANLIGVAAKEPYPALFEKGKGIDRDAEYPSMSDLTKDWAPITEQLTARIKAMTDTEAQANSPIQLPVSDGSMCGLLAFFMHHEGYHLGQLGLLRKHAGLEAMGYK